MTFRLSDQRCEEIKDIVVSLFEKCNIKTVPISGFEIAMKIGAFVIPYSSKPLKKQNDLLKISEDGFSTKYDGTWYIFYNDKKGYGRTNNTIIHECGHIVLAHTQESDLAEAEANFLQNMLLLHPCLFISYTLKMHTKCMSILISALKQLPMLSLIIRNGILTAIMIIPIMN